MPFPLARVALLAVVVGLLVGGAAYLVHGAVAPAPPLKTDAGAAARPSPPESSPARRAYAALTPEQRVGQLFVIGVTSTGPTDEQLELLKQSAGGNVFLRGHSDLGLEATKEVTDRLAEVTTHAGVRPFVAADQEGGSAQALTGEGFTTIPSGVRQGELDPSDLRDGANGWAKELRDAGVTLNLAPVADVVPSDVGTSNEPIGRTYRQLGSNPDDVGASAAAFVAGMRAGRVPTSVKHFPGLGRATGNTDSDPRATDPTTKDDELLGSFRGAVRGGPAFVMVASARYPDIDGERACFSTTVLQDMLRDDLGYRGAVISDSFGSASLAAYAPGDRAVRFLQAGGTLVLHTNWRDLAPMTQAVLAKAKGDPAFAAVVRRDVLRVLGIKARFGLLD